MTVSQQAKLTTKEGTNFKAVHTGKLENLDQYELEVPALNRTVNGKLFTREFLGFSGMQISMNKLPAGRAVPFYHAHKENEEAYIFTGGKGQMQIDGTTFDVEEGTIVRIGTAGERTLRNNSDSDLYYICIQAKEGSLNQETFEDGVRPDKAVVWPE